MLLADSERTECFVTELNGLAFTALWILIGKTQHLLCDLRPAAEVVASVNVVLKLLVSILRV